jgi:hypothetical protein
MAAFYYLHEVFTMSHGTCPTVRVEDGDGSYVVINESDFDSKAHTRYASKEAKPAPVMPTTDTPSGGESEPTAPRKGTVAWYEQELAAKGIEVPEGATKADLKALLEPA